MQNLLESGRITASTISICRKHMAKMVVVTVLFAGCLQTSIAQNSSGVTVHQKKTEKLIELLLSDWKLFLNSTSDALEKKYLAKALKISSDGTIIQGSKSISDEWMKRSIVIDSIENLGDIMASRDSTVIYGIRRFWMADGKKVASLFIFRTNDTVAQIELEFTTDAQPGLIYSEAIEKRRQEWMRLCNAHNAQELVEEMYTANSIYYSHRPVIIGHKAITDEYSYMNRGSYSLTLSPRLKEAINDQLAFEIGQCSGSYGGQYVLIWQKGQDGKWRILLDSNI